MVRAKTLPTIFYTFQYVILVYLSVISSRSLSPMNPRNDYLVTKGMIIPGLPFNKSSRITFHKETKEIIPGYKPCNPGFIFLGLLPR